MPPSARCLSEAWGDGHSTCDFVSRCVWHKLEFATNILIGGHLELRRYGVAMMSPYLPAATGTSAARDAVSMFFIA
jgi:hypothetical protein